MSNDDALFLTTADVMRMFSVSLSTVKRWIADGHLQSRKFGRVVRITTESALRLAGNMNTINLKE